MADYDTATADRKRTLLQALRGPRPVSPPIDLGNGIVIQLKILSSGDKDQCRFEASTAARTQNNLADADREAWINADTAYRVLAMALIDPDTGEPIGTPEDIRNNISTPNLGRLSEEYRRLEAMVAPEDAADLDALYAEVQRHLGESEAALLDFLQTVEYSTLLRFTRSMAVRLASSTPSKS